MAQQQFAAKYRNNITHTRVMSLWGKNEEDTFGSFNIYISGNTLRLRVYTGLSEDKNRYTKTINFDFKDTQIVSFLTILDTLLSMKDIPFDGKKLTALTSIFGFIKTKDMQKAERRELGKIVIGRDENGMYYISAINNTHGRVKFYFYVDRDIVLYDINSQEPLSKNKVSEKFMVSFVNNAKRLIANVLTQEYVEKEDKEEKTNNRSNNKSSSSGSEPNTSDDADDLFL